MVGTSKRAGPDSVTGPLDRWIKRARPDEPREVRVELPDGTRVIAPLESTVRVSAPNNLSVTVGPTQASAGSSSSASLQTETCLGCDDSEAAPKQPSFDWHHTKCQDSSCTDNCCGPQQPQSNSDGLSQTTPVSVADSQSGGSSSSDGGLSAQRGNTQILLPNLPDLPKPAGRKQGKYISKGTAKNGFQSTVVFVKDGAKTASACCWVGGCTKSATFGFEGNNFATSCGTCKQSGMVDVKNRRCPCGKQPNFGFKGDSRATCCATCKQDGMVNIRAKLCGCGHQPCFGFENDKRPTCCSFCKQNGMVDIMNRKCQCGIFPCFGFEGDVRATCCATCKKDGMVDIKNRHCKCGVCPSFGFKGDARATCCVNCKKEGMVNIVSKLCVCGLQPAFGFEGDSSPTCCATCKKDGMVDIKTKRCACGHKPCFGFEGDGRPSCCANCKQNGMVNILCKRCQCGKQPGFGFEGDDRATCCADCKQDGMINITSVHCPCGHQPCFGFESDERPTRCSTCKQHGMIDIRNRHCLCGSGKQPVFPDMDGNQRSLCRMCAIAEGTHPERIIGASYVACRFFCALRALTQGQETVPHVHWDRASGRWNDFQEVRGLVPGRALRPDGFLKDSSGDTRGTVYLFHGNRWHGYPPSHKNYGDVFVYTSARTGATRELKASDLYERTRADTDAYRAAGYRVVTVWEHEFKEHERGRRSLRSAMRTEEPTRA